MRKKVLSGSRPTGKLHIGHLFGVLHKWRDIQDKYDCYFEVADWHALTTHYENTEDLRQNIIDMVIDWLSVGIDPQRSVVFVQSDVKEHAELHLLFSMLVTLSRLLRNPTFKEYVAELRTSELSHKGKKSIDSAALLAAEDFMELMKKEYSPQKLENKDFVQVLRAKIKDRIQEGLLKALSGSEDELPYGHLVNYGFLGYPVLQAADILIYRAEVVPIGEDQLPHLELTRDIARRFNSLYGEVFPIPEPLFTKFAKVPGTDGRKMSKSYGNTILISEPPDSLRKKVMSTYTDPEKIRLRDPGHPDRCPIFAYHKIFNPEETAEIRENCEKGELGCVACKRRVAEKMIEYLEPFRRKREELEKDIDLVKDVLREGSEKARVVTSETMKRVRNAMKLWNGGKF